MYTELITKIKNAQAVKKENLRINYTKIDEAIAEILVKNKFIKEFETLNYSTDLI